MQNPDIARIAEEYRRMSDEQISELLVASPGDFLPQAYQALLHEAAARGLSPASAPAVVPQPPDEAGSEETLVQIAVINNASDLAFLESLLAGTDITHNFMNMRLRYRTSAEFPVALYVESSRVDDTIELLKDFQPHDTIVLW